MTYIAFFTIIMFGACLEYGLFYTALMIGLQEAEDPEQCRPEDMSHYERHHVHRRDVVISVEAASKMGHGHGCSRVNGSTNALRSDDVSKTSGPQSLDAYHG